MPTYYIMDHDRTMAETVAQEMPSPAEIAACSWLTEAELRVYSSEYARTGFQGGLQHYRSRTQGVGVSELHMFGGRTIDLKSMFIAGASDWGIYQSPGAIERMQKTACTAMVASTCWTAPATGSSRRRPPKSRLCWCDFLREG